MRGTRELQKCCFWMQQCLKLVIVIAVTLKYDDLMVGIIWSWLHTTYVHTLRKWCQTNNVLHVPSELSCLFILTGQYKKWVTVLRTIREVAIWMLVGGYIGAAQNYRPLMDIGRVGNHVLWLCLLWGLHPVAFTPRVTAFTVKVVLTGIWVYWKVLNGSR